MKYFEELTDIENPIIRLNSMSSVLRVLSAGAESSDVEDVREALWYVEGSIESIHEELRIAFHELWEKVVEDDTAETVERIKSKHKGGMKKKKMMTDRELP